jgi:hypothetical protein
MKLRTAIVIAILSSTAAIAGPARAPIESGSVINEQLNGQYAVLEEMVQLVRASGYRCDSISAAIPMALSRGFKLTCNRFSYKYEIEDKGGRWRVTLM